MIDLLNKITEAGIVLDVVDGKLKLFAENIDNKESIINEIRNNKESILSYLIEESNITAKASKYEEIPVTKKQESYPLSDGQYRIWVLSQLEESSISYNLPFDIPLTGEYDVDCFKLAINAVIEKHEILRTVFTSNEVGEVRQFIIPKEQFHLDIGYVDYRNCENKEKKVTSFIQKDASVPFNLEKGPLLRVHLIQLEDDKYVFYYNMHHIISDGWSIDILSKDVLSFYESFKQGIQVSVSPLRIQYKDYAVWQRDQLKTQSSQEDKQYWTDRLTGELPVLELPTDRLRPSIKTTNGRSIRTYLSKEVTQSLKTFSKKHGGSLFASLLSISNILLHKYTGTNDIIMGSPIAGREHPDLEDQIGFYVNTLALRNHVDAEDSFIKFHEEVTNETLQAYSHQMYPFDRLVEDLGTERDISRNAIFDVMLVLQNASTVFEGYTVTKQDVDTIKDMGSAVSKFDIELSFQEIGEHLSLHINYNTDVYDYQMLEGFVHHFKNMVQEVLKNPNVLIKDIEYLSSEEKNTLLREFNNTQTDYPREKNIIEIFKEQVVQTPDHKALIFEDRNITYKELDILSDQLANYLELEYTIQKGDFVGLKLNRSEWQVVSLMAILKLGGIYVPIDPNYPKDRVDYIIQDTDCKLIVDDEFIKSQVFLQQEYQNYVSTTQVLPSDLTYIMYTSGSTGTPKGVKISHNNIVRLVKSTNYYNFSGVETLLGTGSFSFDAITFEVFGPLLNGASLVLTSKDVLLDSDLLSEEITKQNVDVMWFTAGWLNELVDTNIGVFKGLKTVLAGGDKLSVTHISKLRNTYPNLEIINGYGPTENTTFSVTYNIKEVTGDIPIGFPISNSTVSIIDDFGNLVPVGVKGEICLGGDGLADGYLNQPELTKEKFIADPNREGKRLYKTGDLGRWTYDGKIKFIGRKDSQVKIRGHRIELGEVEYQLKSKESIHDAIALAIDTNDTDKELVAFLVSNTQETAEDLRGFLAGKLPDYMLPGSYIFVNAIPLTANGKADRRALKKEYNKQSTNHTVTEETRSTTEQALLDIWKEVLHKEQLSIHDDFFLSGGNSLKVIKIIASIQKRFNTKIKVRQFYENSTVSQLAKILNDTEKKPVDNIEIIPVSNEGYDISNEQLRIWLASQSKLGSVSHHMVADYDIVGELDVAVLTKVFESILNRHEALRTRFRMNANGDVKQHIQDHIDVDSVLTVISDENAFSKSELDKILETFKNEDFDLTNEPLFRILILKRDDDRYIMSYAMHHIIGDFGSFEILSEEIKVLYDSLKNNTVHSLPDLKVQNKDYVAWIKNKLSNDTFKQQESFLNEHLDAITPKNNWINNSTSKTFNGESYSKSLDKDLFVRIKEYCEQTRVGLLSVMSSALSILIHKMSGHNDVLIGLPISLRNHPDLMNQVGLYLNVLPLRVSINELQTAEDLIDQVANQQKSLMDASFYPFDKILENFEKKYQYNLADRIDIYLNVIHHASSTNETVHGDGFDNLQFSHREKNTIKSKFPICVYVHESENEISFTIEYQTEVFDEKEVVKIGERFNMCIKEVLTQSNIGIGKINLVQKESIPTFNF